MDRFQQFGVFGVSSVLGFAIGTILYRWILNRPLEPGSAIVIGLFSGFFVLTAALLVPSFRKFIVRK